MAKAVAVDYSDTVLDALLGSLEARAAYNANEHVAPAAVLWTDVRQEWLAIAPRLREHVPQFLTLGEYDLDHRQGPAIWIRAVLAGSVGAAPPVEDGTPIVYLPGVSRQQLRAVDNCPSELQPLAELQYRAEMWNQAGGIDWTINAFLQSKNGGLDLDVAGDAATQEAMRRAVEVLADTRVADLRGRRLEASDFDALLSGDTVRDLLEWMDEPATVRTRWKADRWGSFRARCKQDFGFDPATDGELTAAELLGGGEPPWNTVWQRFTEAPERYTSIPKHLRAAAPTDLFLEGEGWPQVNEGKEDALRSALCELEGRSLAEARERIGKLEAEHGLRREWVWARIGQSPLAKALAYLDTIAALNKRVPAFAGLDEAADYYGDEGWRIDGALLSALEAVRKTKDVNAVHAALRALYLPWLEQSAERFQTQVAAARYPKSPDVEADSGTCLLFADGLRFDVAQRLSRNLRKAGLEIGFDTRWASLPTVTATCKPAVSPVAGLIAGTLKNEDFLPEVAGSGKSLSTANFRKLLEQEGWQVLNKEESGDPSGRAWTEIGALDGHGHDEGWKLAWRLDEELEAIEERISDLFEAGWREVRVVTDHGWLLVPGKLSSRKMPRQDRSWPARSSFRRSP